MAVVPERQNGVLTWIGCPAMPNDLTVQAPSLGTIGNDSAGACKPAAVAAATNHATPVAAASPNPTLQLNMALGVVVLEFRNSTGTITSSIPSQQQLDAYRQWQEARIGPAPQLGAEMVAGAGTAAPTAAPAERPTVPATPAGHTSGTES